MRKILPLQYRVTRYMRKRGVPVYTRRAWALPEQRGIYRARRKVRPHLLLPKKPADTLVWHISVTRDDGPDKTDFIADMRELHRIGMERFGSGVSYNFGIDMTTGEVGIGQSLHTAGTHTVNDKELAGFSHNQNAVAIGVVFIGMPGQHLSAAAQYSAVSLVAALVAEGALTEHFDNMPHSAFAFKDCPTDNVRAFLPKFKRRGVAVSKFE